MQPQQPFYQQPGAFQVAPGPDNSKRNKLIIVIGILFALAVILLIISSLSKPANTGVLIQKVVARNNEELRVNELISNYSQDYDLLQFKSNLTILSTSDNNNLRSFLDPEAKPDELLIASVTDADVETRFKEAANINYFIREYKSTVSKLLNDNLADLKTIRKVAKKDDLKNTLDTAIANHEALLRQIDRLE